MIFIFFFYSYNAVNGVPACGNKQLLQDWLRNEFGFDGYVVGDCGAVLAIWQNHRYVDSLKKAVAVALINGTDLDCGDAYQQYLKQALQDHLIDMSLIDQAVTRVMKARFQLGMFDLPTINPYMRIPLSVSNSAEHRAIALQAAQEAIVLLKNEKGVLPLSKQLASIAVIGPNANDPSNLSGNYAGINDNMITPWMAISKRVQRVYYAPGCNDVFCNQTSGFADAYEAAKQADVVVLIMGLSLQIEEEMVDRTQYITLPGYQELLIRNIYQLVQGKPVVVVFINGGPISFSWTKNNVDAILEAYYGGEEAGTALANVLFGDYSPAGRLVGTYYTSLSDLPAYSSMSMKGRTYRYYEGVPLYRFGDGLSYTTFAYSNLQLSSSSIQTCQSVNISVQVKNTGSTTSDEVVQVYLSNKSAKVPVPRWSLIGFERVKHLQPGQTRTVHFGITPEQLSVVLDDGSRVVEPDEFVVYVGGGQPDSDLQGKTVVQTSFSQRGSVKPLKSC